jgi:hypothetical protein
MDEEFIATVEQHLRTRYPQDEGFEIITHLDNGHRFEFEVIGSGTVLLAKVCSTPVLNMAEVTRFLEAIDELNPSEGGELFVIPMIRIPKLCFDVLGMPQIKLRKLYS